MTELSKAVFLSYASQDAVAALRICEALRAAGIEVWFDQSELRGGDAWDASIRKQIKACVLFMPIISANTHAREEGYFRLEWKLAVDRSHLMAGTKAFMVPVVIDETSDDDERTPEKFRDVQWTRLPGGETPPTFCQRIKGLLDGAEPHTARVQSDKHIAAASAPAEPTSRWMIPAIGAVLVVLVGGGWVWRMVRAGAVTSSAAVPVPLAVAPEKSIAVLPFVDMSEKHDQEYFSDGLSEELIDRLAQTPDLHVPARTSSFYFKNQHVTVAEIARALGVAHLLEGSVRKAGKELRVTAQLIRVSDGYHLWSDSYDRQVKDVFKVQDDIANEVVQALKATLAHATGLTKDRIENVTAHNLLLQGRFFEQRLGPGDPERAIRAYESAIATDPGYALAWADLSWALIWQVPRGDMDRAGRAASKAVELQPDLAQAYTTRGWYESQVSLDWAAADKDFDTALALDPNNTQALHGKGQLARVFRHYDVSLRYYREIVARDPVNRAALQGLATTLVAAGQAAEAVSIARRVLDLDPDYQYAHSFLSVGLYWNGQVEAARLEAQREPNRSARLTDIAYCEWALHHPAQADAALSELLGISNPDDMKYIAGIYAARGDADRAMQWLERGLHIHSLDLDEVSSDRSFDPIRGDPRFKSFLRKMGLKEA